VIEDVSPDADLRSLGGRKLLFSEATQAIYEIDELTAFVWQSLRAGMSSEAVVDELVRAGVDEASATPAVAQALAQLQAIPRSTQNPARAQSEPLNAAIPIDGLTAVTVEIPHASVVDVHLSEDLVPDVIRTLGYLRTDRSESDCRIIARSAGETIEFYPPDKAMWLCKPADFVATLKADLLEQVLRLATYEVALHTAALIRNGKALLLAGAPGAGKSTLSLALSRAGWELAADDVVLVLDDGLIIGLPFPITAKSSSWPMIDRHWPELAAREGYHRPDGFDVRYILPDRIAAPGPWTIGAVVILDRQPDGEAQLEDVEPADMLGTLISEATSRDQQLTRAGFRALVTALDNARCAKLTYSGLFDGVRALDGLCA